MLPAIGNSCRTFSRAGIWIIQVRAAMPFPLPDIHRRIEAAI
ncbi:hypothetical protein [Delftia acidovorans]